MTFRAKVPALALTLVTGALTFACGRSGGPEQIRQNPPVSVPLECAPAQSSQPLPALQGAGTPSGSTKPYFTTDLFDLFRSTCGGCHVAGSYGGFTVTALTFPQQVTQSVLDRVLSDDPSVYMPPAGSPTGKPYSQRAPTDPIVQLVGLLTIWIAQGSPSGSFDLNAAGSGASPAGAPVTQPASVSTATPLADYSIPPQLGARLTNIGSCVPDRRIVAVNVNTMKDLDAAFASATQLPGTLAETDLVTFDSNTLARNGVISFAPAYPLWSDDAGKMRHVRLPRGTTITFDKGTQQFQIPPNTRFYKTFLKKVIDADGNERYRKIETRLIVSRPDQTLADGTATPTALFGTYVWNPDETEAVLNTLLLNNQQPATFKDRVFSYIVDGPKAEAIKNTNPPNLDYALEIQNPGVLRHYAIPGSERCIQCHMGSPSASFVLGFTPLQVSRAPAGTSGVIEDAAGGELTQLQRLIDYGLISGMTSPADVTPLEKTQLPRAPRNNYELAAQAYMVGNCAHCHNPRGYPSVKAPELKDVLSFLPGPDGGIFQFPLDRMSPRRSRGFNHDVPIPYITPSLRDYVDQGGALYPPKYIACDGPVDGWCAKAGQVTDFIDAPWRSLIYRNVDTPFDYVDDFTIFPHMPLNTSGYDCRVKGIMGDWMVSIPALRLNPGSEDVTVSVNGDNSPQPYVEVTPGAAGYDAAQASAQKRLVAYHAGHRYNYCPDTIDIVDPAVENGQLQTPADLPIFTFLPDGSRQEVMPAEGVPDRPNYVVTDATDPPAIPGQPNWVPRQPQWGLALLAHKVTNPDAADQQAVIDKLKNVILTPSTRAALLAEVPFGLWQQKPGCDFSGVPKAGSYQGDSRPLWMDVKQADPNAPVYALSAGAAVFMNICTNCHGPQADAKGILADEITIMTGGDARVANFRTGLFGSPVSPGANRAVIFGPDGLSEKAKALASQTNADGTQSYPGFTWQYDGADPDDYGARYVAFMALGGTQKKIPLDLLRIVASTPVLGKSRATVAGGSPNMLQLAQELCANALPAHSNARGHLDSFFNNRTLAWGSQSELIGENGDAELWLKVCTLNNRPVVRVPVPENRWTLVKDGTNLAIRPLQSLFWGDGYPANAPVLDNRGRIVSGVRPDNLFPLCVQKPGDPTEAAAADAFLQTNPVGGSGGSVIPYCPPELFASATDAGGNVLHDDAGSVVRKWQLASTVNSNGTLAYTDANDWAIQGAINAGEAVFLYVDQVAKGLVTPKPLFNQCDLLQPAQSPARP
jgi:mono/diheme cytochrome c family protein